MKQRIRWKPALLAAAMLLSLLLSPFTGSAAAAESAAVGTVSATVRLDYDQSLAELQKRQVKAELWQGKSLLGALDLTRAGYQSLAGGYAASVSLRGADGGTFFGEWPSYLDMSVGGLPQGTYTLRFTGVGYVAYEETVTLADYSRHVIVGTGDATFSLGDFDRNGRVDTRDRDALAAALGSQESRDLNIYDLNGDRAIDIIDLAYVNRQLAAAGGSQVLETALLRPPVAEETLRAELDASGVAIVSGDLADLFLDNGKAVTFQANAAGQIILPFTFRQAAELEQIRIVSSASAPILAGMVEVEDVNGEVFRYSFDNTLPEGVHALSVQEGSNVITVDLGKRIAVKKITITVTKTEAGFATVEAIQFLKEMVPVDPAAASSQVTGLTAAAGSEKVSLRWNTLPNVSGYRVDWWPAADPGKVQTLFVETNQAEITGLSNMVDYQFTVTAIDGAWSGKASEPVTATPMPASAPDAPDMVSVTELDGALQVSWKASKNALWYEVYYTDQPNASASAYKRFGDSLTGTGTTITGLTNSVAYYIYIVAGNDAGRSGPSKIASGTPKAVDYERPAGIPTQGVLEGKDFASIRLADPSNYSQSEYTSAAPFIPGNMADGDYRTHWTAKDWYHNEHVVVTFKEPQDLSAAIWVPRLDGTYANDLRAYSVQVWYEGEDLGGAGHLVTGGVDRGALGSDTDMQTWPTIPGNTAQSKFAVMPFEPQKNVIQVSVAAEQRDYLLVTLSELMFLKYDEYHRLPDEIGELFANPLCTTLASGVTQARIDALKARLESDERYFYLNLDTLADELALAQELLDSKKSSGVVLSGVHSISSAVDSAAYGQGGSNLQPLGAAAAAGQEITVYASGIPDGETVEIYATQFNAEANAWLASVGKLSNGRNILTVPKIGSGAAARGGSLYFTYSGSQPQNIQLHVRRAVDIPVLELTDWNTMSTAERTGAINAYIAELTAYAPASNASTAQTNWQNVTEIATPSVLLSLPAQAALSGLKSADKAGQLADSVEAWEQLMMICRTVQGIGGTMQSRQNIRCMQMFAGAFMYAAGNHVGIGYGSCSGMVGGAPVSKMAENAQVNQLFGWGIAHEIGHNMDKLGKAEITNNIYSLAVQTYDGNQNTLPSRLEGGKYDAIFNKTAQSRPGASGDVFVQLGMYWQLHLAYDEGDSAHPMKFFYDFFTAWKNGTYTKGVSAYDDKVALTASGVAGRDLTDFFTHWGMELSETALEEMKTYEEETRAIWYLSDQSRRDRLNGVPAAEGTLTVAAEAVGEKSVALTFSFNVTNAGKIQGYEIIRNSENGPVPVAFTTTGAYTDTIESGNNRTYSYTVAAYDSLGNKLGEQTTGEFKISYDLLVDTDEYTVSRNGSTVTFTMKQPTPVTGLRLPLEGLDGGAFTVEVTDENGKHTVRQSDFRENQADGDGRFISYFQMEGDEDGNDRIVAYFASAVTVTGIPESVKDADIRLISYVGDDISFLDGPTVGKLANDYTYDTGDGTETIEAGTLVIVGTFQGDPIYNTVRISGEYAAPDMEDTNTDFSVPGVTVRNIPGEVLLFVQEQKDTKYGTVSDGIFLFIPDVQAEAGLQGDEVSCGGGAVLPARIRAELWRTIEPDSAEGTRCTAQTLWIASPGGDELPLVELKGDAQ